MTHIDLYFYYDNRCYLKGAFQVSQSHHREEQTSKQEMTYHNNYNIIDREVGIMILNYM